MDVNIAKRIWTITKQQRGQNEGSIEVMMPLEKCQCLENFIKLWVTDG